MAANVDSKNGSGTNFTQRQKKLFTVLMIGIFFEGFDDALINIVLPYITADFGLNNQQAGFSLSIIGLGTMFAFFLVRLADNLGRRPIFLTSVIAYTLCSAITAFSPAMTFLVFFQFLARIFLIACWSLGYVIVSEEFEVEQRGKASSILQVVATSGALVLSLLLPVLTLLGLNWRAMYLIGALPLIPVLVFHKNLPETKKFLEMKRARLEQTQREKNDFFEVWKPQYRKYLIVMAIVWFFLYFGVKGALNFFSQHVVNDLSFTPLMVSIALVTQTLVGMVIIALNGRMLDKIGRKKGAIIIIVTGSCAAAALFLVKSFALVLLIGCFATGFTNSFLIVGSTITNELFPTEVRANAMAWTNNILGRIGQVLVPTFIGSLSVVLGLAHAVAFAVLLPLIAALLIAVFIPETKDLTEGE